MQRFLSPEVANQTGNSFMDLPNVIEVTWGLHFTSTHPDHKISFTYLVCYHLRFFLHGRLKNIVIPLLIHDFAS